jgi:hypothetical protein
MAAEWLTFLGILLLVAVASRFSPRARLRSPSAGPWSHARMQDAPPRRSIEELVGQLRRLAPKFHQPPPGTSRVKVEAARYAYDRVLGEVATAVGVDHLMSVLEPGDDLDAERSRVENRLWLAGVRFEEAA